MTNSEPTAYQVSLPVFEGPLDLLLHLIERQELDITQVSLAQVTNQYLDYLSHIGERNPDNLADFLVVAAKLLLIKSRVLLPQPPAPAADEEDVGEDLVHQLLVYKQFKQAAGWLKDLEAQGRQAFVRLAGAPSLERTADLTEVTLDDLLAAVRRVLDTRPPVPSVDGMVPAPIITIAEQMEVIRRETAGGRSVSFFRLLERASGRLEIVVTLLAVLEMVKQLRLRIRQEQPFGDIVLEQAGPAPTSA